MDGLLQPAQDVWIPHSGACLTGENSADGLVGGSGVDVPACGKQHRAAVEIEMPRATRAESDVDEHRRERGRGVVSVVTVP